MMRAVFTSVLTSLLVLGAITAFALGSDVDIVVSPNNLVLSSQGEWVTVHAEIPYSSVDGSTVELNGVAAVYTKSDARGELVAKFDIEEVKAIVTPPSATLTLTGLADDGYFSGTDTIDVQF